MMKTQIILFLLFIVVISACSETTTINNPPTVTNNFRPTVTLQPTPFNPAKDPTQMAFYFEPDERNDGIISLTIVDEIKECHLIGGSIKIRMIFKNLTNQKIIIPDTFSISTNTINGSGIFASLMPIPQDSTVFYPVIGANDGIMNPRNPNIFYDLPENGTLEKIISYEIPSEFLVRDNKSNDGYYLSVGSGRYLLKFSYTLNKFNAQGKWESFIGRAVSSQIEICIR